MSQGKPQANKGIPIDAILQAYGEHGTFAATAMALGCAESNVRSRLKRHWAIEVGHENQDDRIPGYTPGAGRVIKKVSVALDKEGKAKSYNVQEKPQELAENFTHPLDKLKRVSTYRGADGQIVGQWQITVADDKGEKKAFDQIIEALKEDLPAYEPITRSTLGKADNLANLYVLSDAHVGSLCWWKESGEDWDLEIAEGMLVAAFKAMIKQSPPAKKAIVALLGDWTHYDKLEAETTLSGNILDSDGRQPKMNKVAIRIARRIVELALAHHDEVELLVAEGNHDIVAAPWLRELFISVYENEPRLKVIDDPRPYYATMVGDSFIGFHHGHCRTGQNVKKAEDLMAIFADEFREMWGKAKTVEIHTGHIHTHLVIEVRGGKVHTHPTLAGRDAWAARRGWGSIRRAISRVYHEKWGATGGVEISPEMLEEVR